MREAAPEHDPDETTTRVLDAAFAEFCEFGIRRASIDSVAQRAGLGRMTVYRRFPGKDALVQAVLLRESDRFLAKLAARIDASTTLEERVEGGFVTGVLAWQEHRLGRGMIDREPQAVLPYLTQGATPILAGIAAFVRARLMGARDADDFRADSIDTACEATVRLAQSYSLTPPWDGPADAARLHKVARTMILPLLVRK